MATLDSFLPLIRGRLPGCPDIVLKDGVRDAAIEFCKRTRLLTQAVDVDVVAGEPVVELYPDDSVAWEVLRVSRSDTALYPCSRSAFLAASLDRLRGTPTSYYLEGDRTLILGPIPSAAETLSAVVVLRPADTANYVADALYSDFRAPLAAGARAWVRRHYGEWSESNMEAEDRRLFENAVHNQNVLRARGGVDAPLRVRANPF